MECLLLSTYPVGWSGYTPSWGICQWGTGVLFFPGGIGLLLNEKISWLEYGKVGMILFCLFLTVCAIEALSRFLSQIIREERRLSAVQKRGMRCC